MPQWSIAFLYTTSAAERDDAVTNHGYQNEGSCCAVPLPPPSSMPVPLYRLVGQQHGDHLLTISLPEVDNAIIHNHYAQEDSCCFVFSGPVPNALPLYRLRGTKSGDRFYTLSAQERDAALARGDYVDEGICCYVPASASQSTTALYRLVNAKKGLHFYTTSTVERDEAVSKYGYANEGLCCQVVSKPPDVIPLYRVFQPGSLDHFYTSSITERGGLLTHGYQSEGICCYVYTSASDGVPLFRTYQTGGYNVHFYTIDPTERDNANKLSFGNEGTCCTVAKTGAPDTEPLYRLAFVQCRINGNSPWETVKDFVSTGIWGDCPIPPSPPKITLTASPYGGYAVLGVQQTLSWNVDDCTSACQITLDGAGTGYASAFKVHLDNLPTISSYAMTPADIVNFTLTAANAVGTTHKQAQFAIAPSNASSTTQTLNPYYFAVKALSDLVPQCTWIIQPSDSQAHAQAIVTATYGSGYTVTSISWDDFNNQRGCP